LLWLVGTSCKGRRRAMSSGNDDDEQQHKFPSVKSERRKRPHASYVEDDDPQDDEDDELLGNDQTPRPLPAFITKTYNVTITLLSLLPFLTFLVTQRWFQMKHILMSSVGMQKEMDSLLRKSMTLHKRFFPSISSIRTFRVSLDN
jgi:hypothetical protein